MPLSEITPFHEGSVRGFLHEPDHPRDCGAVLTHGAGGNCNAPIPAAAANAFRNAGAFVLRCDLPFRQRRAFGPPPPSSGAEDRAGLRDAVAAMRKRVTGRIFLGGHSYGGRQASMLAAEMPEVCDGLVLFSYPLHPPGKELQPRTAHFPAIRMPAWFVHGTKDPFGSTEEMREAIRLIPGPAELVTIGGAGHDLMKGKFDLAALASRMIAI